MPFFPLRDDNPAHRFPVVTVAIIGLNVVMLIWLTRLTPLQQELVVYERGFVPARIGTLFTGRALEVQIKQEVTDKRTGRRGILEHAVRLDSSPRSVLSSLITTMFLHAGIAHLLGNMWFLLIFGNNVEDRLGHVPFLLFYLLGGLLATTGHWLQEPGSLTPVIGASGAVASILGAYAVTWPWARIHTLLLLGCIPLLFDFPALLVLGVWFVAQLLSARERMGIDMSGGVAFLAHVCGFVAGTVLMPMARRIIPDRSPRPAPLHYDDETPQYIDERWDPDRYS